jgi:hypothetical protein
VLNGLKNGFLSRAIKGARVVLLLGVVKHYIEDFRTTINFLNASNQRSVAYKSYCLSMGIGSRKFVVDVEIRWNSTFLMLKHLMPHKSTFYVFIQTNYPFASDGTALLNNNHWYVVEKPLYFIQLFYDSTVILSGVYYPTSPLMLHQNLKIVRHFNALENDALLR